MSTKRNLKQRRRALDGIMKQPRVPRPRVSAKPSRDSCEVDSKITAISLTSVYPNGRHLVNPPFYGYNDPGGMVIRNYQYYRMLSARIVYTPLCGSTTPGQIWLAYFDNPELIYKIWTNAITWPNMLLLAQSATHSVRSPVWQGVEMALPMSARRAKYSVDSTEPTTIPEIDRCVHGIVVMVTTGVDETTPAFGSCTLEYRAKGSELQNQTITSL